MFPALLLWLVSTGRPVVRILLSLCLACLVIRIGYVLTLELDDSFMRERIYRSSETRMDSILLGCIVAVMARGELLKRYAGVWMIFAALALMVIIKAYGDVSAFRDTIKFTLQPLVCAFALAGILYAKPGYLIGLVRRVLNCLPMVFIGQISFSLYLLHTAMNHLAASFLPWGPHDWQSWLPSLALAILASWACYRFIEQPMIRIGKRPMPCRRASSLLKGA